MTMAKLGLNVSSGIRSSSILLVRAVGYAVLEVGSAI